MASNSKQKNLSPFFVSPHLEEDHRNLMRLYSSIPHRDSLEISFLNLERAFALCRPEIRWQSNNELGTFLSIKRKIAINS
jgi:hypothetical protein